MLTELILKMGETKKYHQKAILEGLQIRKTPCHKIRFQESCWYRIICP